MIRAIKGSVDWSMPGPRKIPKAACHRVYQADRLSEAVRPRLLEKNRVPAGHR